MPRYFFHVLAEHTSRDMTGKLLPDVAAAKAEAARFAGELFCPSNGRFGQADVWRMRVADEQNATVFDLRFSQPPPRQQHDTKLMKELEMEDSKLYRQRAIAERDTAEAADLDNVRERSMRSAKRWDELATRAEEVQAGAAARAASKLESVSD